MAAKKKTEAVQEVQIPPLQLDKIRFRIEGVTPLIVNCFSKAKGAKMLEAQMKKPRQKKPPREPEKDFIDSLYPLDEEEEIEVAKENGSTLARGHFGFPLAGFKQAMVGACRYVDGLTMTAMKGAFHVGSDEDFFLAPLLTPGGDAAVPKMRQDMVRNATGVADVRFRGEFAVPWCCDLVISYNGSVVTPDLLAHLLNVGGFSQGIGEWRPGKSGGGFGQFKLAEG